MDRLSTFLGHGKWYKGNLHCHSTVSDGKLSPDDVVKLYKKNGWNFLALTEHETYSNYGDKYDGENFIMLPGIEASANDLKAFNYNHILGIGNGDVIKNSGSLSRLNHLQKLKGIPWNGWNTMQKTINELNSKNNITIIAHPDWSRSNFDVLNKLTGYTAIEIFNYGCSVESNSGLSTAYWDYLLRQGKKILGIATDDAHHILKDECGGWITIEADDLNRESILNSIIEGRFYSSNGPEIYEFYIEDGYVYVKCSNVKHIHIMAYGYWTWGRSCHADPGGFINSAKYKINGYEKYIRIECEDQYGRKAWSNPIFLNPKEA